jgi:hypothetical protein
MAARLRRACASKATPPDATPARSPGTSPSRSSEWRDGDHHAEPEHGERRCWLRKILAEGACKENIADDKVCTTHTHVARLRVMKTMSGRYRGGIVYLHRIGEDPGSSEQHDTEKEFSSDVEARDAPERSRVVRSKSTNLEFRSLNERFGAWARNGIRGPAFDVVREVMTWVTEQATGRTQPNLPPQNPERFRVKLAEPSHDFARDLVGLEFRVSSFE